MLISRPSPNEGPVVGCLKIAFDVWFTKLLKGARPSLSRSEKINALEEEAKPPLEANKTKSKNQLILI